MAIKFNERYPGRSLPASTRYPQGGFKNRSAPESKDGTYLEQDWANDISGFLQWLMSKADFTANGSPDDAINSQYGDALKKMVSEWQQENYKNATEQESGVIAISSSSEARAQSNDSKALTPKKLADAFSGNKSMLSVPGFQHLPGGLEMKFDSFEVPSGSNDREFRRVWSTPFKTASLILIPTIAGPTSSRRVNIGSVMGRTEYSVIATNTASGTPTVVRVFAIGH